MKVTDAQFYGHSGKEPEDLVVWGEQSGTLKDSATGRRMLPEVAKLQGLEP